MRPSSLAIVQGDAVVSNSPAPIEPQYLATMGWASAATEKLSKGQTVTVRPRGHSMIGKVNDGDHVTVEPLGERDLTVGDVVLVRCHGYDYLHLVKARQGERFLIGNNRGGINGWVSRRAIFGVAVRIE